MVNKRFKIEFNYLIQYFIIVNSLELTCIIDNNANLCCFIFAFFFINKNYNGIDL